jgi:Zn-dependent membrane protease YugP
MSVIFFILMLLAVVFLPGLWVRRVLTRYSTPEDRYSGTGEQLARHLLDKNGLQTVAVEAAQDSRASGQGESKN